MEISIIPRWIIKYFYSDFFKQNDYNILISNLLILVLFFFFGSKLILTLNEIPHFCLIDRVLGVECPVCGTTRAFCELSKGNIQNALFLNRTSVLVASFFLFQIPLRFLSISKIIKTKKVNLISKYFSQMILALILLNWIINLFI